MKKYMIISLAPLVLLSACSVATNSGDSSTNATKASTSTFSKLQQEYQQYTYSAYVKDNLKASPIMAKSTEEISTNEIALNALKQQLESRKRSSANRLGNERNQNGIYKVSRGLQQQTLSLNSKEKSQSWLKNHSSLDGVLALVIKNNLDIQSAQEQAQASLSKYDQVGFLDDMLSQYATFTKSISLTGSTQKHKKSVSSSFPFPGLLSLKASIIDQAVDASRLQIKQTTQDAITNARMAYYELQYIQHKTVLLKKNIGLLKSLKEELKSSYSTNSAELSGILQVDIEIADYRNKLLTVKDRQQAQSAKLGALLNLSPNFRLGKLDRLRAEKLPANTSQLIKKAKEHRIEITRLQTDLEKMKRIIQLSEKRFYPDFDAGYSRFQNDQFTTNPKIKKNDFFAKNDAYLNETKQKYKALQLKIAALKNKTADDIQQAISSYQTQKNTRGLYQNEVLPKARTSLEIAKSLYETGESSLAKVIDTEKMIVNYQLKSLKALKDMNINAAKVNRLVGTNVF